MEGIATAALVIKDDEQIVYLYLGTYTFSELEESIENNISPDNGGDGSVHWTLVNNVYLSLKSENSSYGVYKINKDGTYSEVSYYSFREKKIVHLEVREIESVKYRFLQPLMMISR